MRGINRLKRYLSALKGVCHFAIPRGKIVDPRQHPYLLCESLTAASYPWNHGPWRSQYLKRAFANYGGKSPISSKRIYISRKSARMRRIVNEDELAPILVRHGFQSIEADQFSFAEQIAIFRRAEVLVGPAGAAFTLLCFCQPGTKGISMMSDADQSEGALMKVWDTVCAFNELDFYHLCADSPNLHVTASTAHFSADLKPDLTQSEQMLDSMLA